MVGVGVGYFISDTAVPIWRPFPNRWDFKLCLGKFLQAIGLLNRTCGLVVRALTSCLVGRRSTWFESRPGRDLKNWNLLQSGQALGIMTVAGMQSLSERPSRETLQCGCNLCRNNLVVCGWEMCWEINTLNKSLPGRSSMPLEGQIPNVDATGRTIPNSYIVCTRNFLCVVQELSAKCYCVFVGLMGHVCAGLLSDQGLILSPAVMHRGITKVIGCAQKHCFCHTRNHFPGFSRTCCTSLRIFVYNIFTTI